MKIDVKDAAEFKRLMKELSFELIDAREHFRLHQNLDAAIPEYQVEFNQSAQFWDSTLSAHIDAALLRLCRAYDLYEGKPSLNLRNFLETIEANLDFFDQASFRERLKDNAFVNSLAADARKPDVTELCSDLESVSITNPLVRKLTIWRNNYFAHRSHSSALDLKGFTERYPILFSEIESLIDNGLRIMAHYSRLFSAEHYASFPIKDYKYLLDAVRRDLKTRTAHIRGQAPWETR